MRLCFPILYCICSALPGVRGVELGEYQIILEKQLLGAERRPTPPVVTPPPETPTPAWSRNYRMTMMTRDQSTGAIRIGLQNIQNQTAILLIEGQDRRADYKLVSANYTQGSAQVSHQGATHRFDLQDGPALRASPSTVSATSTRSSSSTPSVSRTQPTVRRRKVVTNRNRPRPPEDTPALQIQRFASQEELQEHLKQQQLDAIRTGKPPLPIPLTPEMDRQLVEEGVLPPLEGP